jgi:hypothetical protein
MALPRPEGTIPKGDLALRVEGGTYDPDPEHWRRGYDVNTWLSKHACHLIIQFRT